MSSNLKKRHQTYYVRVGINPKHWDVMGKREIVRSLKTHDRRVAERIKHNVIAEIKEYIDRTVRDAGVPVSDPRWLLNIARELRSRVAADEMDSADAGELLALMRDKHHGAAGVSEDKTPRVSIAATRMVAEPDYMPLNEAIRDYLGAIKRRIRNSTWQQKKRQLEDFAKWAGDVSVTDVDRRLAGRYVIEVLAKNELAPRTNNGILAVLIAFYEWLIKRGLYEKLNPFMKQSDAFQGSTRGNGNNSYRAWTKDELAKLFEYFEGCRKGTTKHKAGIAARIALYSGMRQDEITSMKTEHVNLEDGFMTIAEAKNENSVRQVPIHPEIKPLIERLVENSTDGYLIPGLKTGGRDSKRSHALGNRFSEVKSGLFPNAGRELAFHGLRSTFITQCEAAGVPEATTKLIVGHARQSLSYGLYSIGPGADVLAEVMEKVKPV